MILLGSNLPQGICYIETKNLDGETNMKHKAAHKFTAACVENDQDAVRFSGRISCQGPNEYLYKFEGNLAFEPDKSRIEDEGLKEGPIQVPLDANQMLLRGSKIFYMHQLLKISYPFVSEYFIKTKFIEV